MGLIAELRSRARHIVGPVLAVCITGYFAYHLIQGDRGLIAWSHLDREVREARGAQAEISAERRQWERRVRLLYPGSLDPDMLDERSRIMLNYGHPGEIVIFEE